MTEDELDLALAASARRSWPGTPPAGALDQAEGLRRLAVDVDRHRAGTYRQPTWWTGALRARTKLESLSRWVINRPSASLELGRLADYLTAGPQLPCAEGARVFGCLLHLTGHDDNAQFWWRFAAGAEDKVSAYCLYLLQIQHGDLRQAQMWFETAVPGGIHHPYPVQQTASTPQDQPTDQRPGPMPPPLDNFHLLLSVFARKSACYGTAAVLPDEMLRAEVERAVIAGEEPVDSIPRHRGSIAQAPPDEALTATFAAFADSA